MPRTDLRDPYRKPLKTAPRSMLLIKRLLTRSKKMRNGCIVYLGAQTRSGHCIISYKGRMAPAHKFMWELKKGKVPKGLQLDHLCRVPNCINVDHLEVVTRKENILRGICPQAKNARKTHCKRGHDLNGKFSVHSSRKDGGKYRKCMECNRYITKRRYYKIRLNNDEWQPRFVGVTKDGIKSYYETQDEVDRYREVGEIVRALKREERKENKNA